MFRVAGRRQLPPFLTFFSGLVNRPGIFTYRLMSCYHWAGVSLVGNFTQRVLYLVTFPQAWDDAVGVGMLVATSIIKLSGLINKSNSGPFSRAPRKKASQIGVFGTANRLEFALSLRQ